MSAVKLCLFIAIIGHLLCWRCDWVITYAPGGRFSAEALKSNEKMSAMYGGMDLKRPEFSMLFGVLAMAMEMLGYLAVAQWAGGFSAAYKWVLGVSAVIAFISGVVQHVLCGAAEWLYVRFGCTEEARETVFELFKKIGYPTMAACAVGMLVFFIALFAAVVTGAAGLPRWACVFNLAVIFIALSPLRIVGTLNLAGALACLGLIFVI